MARIDDLIREAIRSLPEKPPDTASRSKKQSFSQKLSEALAQAFAQELRNRGLKGTRPAPPGELDKSGAERRMSGGIGAKKVDVSWATEESGLLCAISIKTINFRDRRTGNFQKNLTNRRGDMLFESVTLHRRFPYSVLIGFLVLDKASSDDSTEKRHSTFQNAHHRLRLFTGRDDPAGRDEQYERLYVCLIDTGPFKPDFQVFQVGKPDAPIALKEVIDDIVRLVSERDVDFYAEDEGRLVRPGKRLRRGKKKRSKDGPGDQSDAVSGTPDE